MEILATFFIGLGNGQWKYAGPYRGRGKDAVEAGENAISCCAIDHAGRDVMFMTFASIRYLYDDTTANSFNETHGSAQVSCPTVRRGSPDPATPRFGEGLPTP